MKGDFNGALDRHFQRQHDDGSDDRCDGCQCKRETHRYAGGYYCTACIEHNRGLLFEDNDTES